MSNHRDKLVALRQERAAVGALLSGQEILAEWKLSEEFIGALARGLFEAAMETCDLYRLLMDEDLSRCVEDNIREMVLKQFEHALRNHSSRPDIARIPAGVHAVLSGRIPRAQFSILNPIQIDLERARVQSEQKLQRECEGQISDMRHNLAPDEEKVLRALAEAYPEKLHLHQLAPRTDLSNDRAALLRIVDKLIVRKMIECVPLRDSAGLVDAANILIADSSLSLLQEMDNENQKSTRSAGLPLVTATVLNVLIASPSDVSDERDVVEKALHEWNASHSSRLRIMLHPIRWESHSYPASGDRPQGLLNKQIVDTGHILIGIFGNRIGTPTGEAQSGTIEEIERFRKTGRYVALYFSNAPVPRNADREQLATLEEYQKERQKDTLYAVFSSPDELHRLVTQHLPKIVSEVYEGLQNPANAAGRGDAGVLAPQPALVSGKAQPTHRDSAGMRRGLHPPQATEDLSPGEIELLWNAAKDPRGQILHRRWLGGEDMGTNGRHFLNDAGVREVAEWLGALRSLEGRGFIEPLSSERSFFKVTDEGYESADHLDGFARWNVEKVVLRAHYMSAPSEERTLACKGIIAIPARYFDDQIGADGSVMRTLKERRSLLVEGTDSRPLGKWTPNEVEFVDTSSGQVQRFRVDGMEFLPPAYLKLPILG